MKLKKVLLLIIIILIHLSCGKKINAKEIPFAKKGVINLCNWDFNTDGSVKLDGEWEFYWEKFYSPEDFNNNDLSPDFYIELPNKWNNYKINEEKIPPIGYGTYRLKIILPDERKNSKLLLKIPSVYSSYSCWLNNDYLLKKGNPTTSKKNFKGSNYPEIIYLPTDKKELFITLNVSNYFFSMSGGIINSLHMGTFNQIFTMTQRKVFFYIVGFGVFIIMFIYYLWFWILRKRDLYNLLFSIICFLMALQSLFISERSIYYIFKNLDIKLFFQLWYLVFALFPIALLFFKEFFPHEINKYVIYISLIIYTICIILNFILPTIIFTAIAPYFYYIGILIVIYIIYANISAIINKRKFAVIFFIGIMIPALSALNDSLYSMGLIKTAFITPVGFTIYLAFQSYLISFKFTRSFTQVETLTSELNMLNKNLEKRIELRTRSLHNALIDVEQKNVRILNQNQKLEKMHKKLSKANIKLKSLASFDHLTGLSNRRMLFDFYKYEWKRSIRERNPISVLFIDVDFFKQFNDTYGHIKGDKVLKEIASILTNVACRPTDKAGRYGGEEFVLILSNTNLKGALVVAENIKNKVENLKIEHKKSPDFSFITISIGVSSLIPKKQLMPEILIKYADNALYKAKEKGRNKIEYILINDNN